MLFFCSADVVLSKAPVGTKSISERMPFSKSFNIFEQRVAAQPPQPEPPVKKVNGKTGDAGKFTYGQTLNYTLTYGSDGISLQGTTISDTMSALQKLNGTITMTYGNNQTMTLNPSGTWGSSSFQYGTDGRQLFS